MTTLTPDEINVLRLLATGEQLFRAHHSRCALSLRDRGFVWRASLAKDYFGITEAGKVALANALDVPKETLFKVTGK